MGDELMPLVSETDIIAEFQFVSAGQTSKKQDCKIIVEKPHLDSDHLWCCRVHLYGMDNRHYDIFGDNSLQALCLALRFTADRLEYNRGKGLKFFARNRSGRLAPIDFSPYFLAFPPINSQ
jgi:hypothetical protein